MNSLFDFITHIKTVEYLMAVGAIALYILYWEVLKPKPFKSLMETGKEDLGYIRNTGYKNTMKMVGKVMAAPFIGLAYIVFLPFTFAYALGSLVTERVLTFAGKEAAFGWRPMEAYLAGRKKKMKKGKKEEDSAGKDEKR
jgi:hypothetical protein